MKYTLGANRNPSGRVLKEYTSVGQLPPSIITDISMLPVLDQAQQPACVGHAGANAVNYDYYKKTGAIPNSSPEFNYTVAKIIDGDTSEGTSALSMFKGWQKYSGSATEATIPNNTQLDVVSYCTVPFNAAILMDAAKYPITTEVEVTNPSCTQLQSLIQQYDVVCIALDVDDVSWMQQDGQGPLKPGNAGGHEILLYGYETVGTDVKFYIRNSWNTSWGQGGNGYFMWSDYQGNVYDAMCFSVIVAPKQLKPTYYFGKNLSMGQTDPDVLHLQKCLNYDPTTALKASIGAPGSPGNETSFFGALTYNAVEVFQKKYGIPVTGTVGPLTRSQLNSLFSMNVSANGISLIESFEGFVPTPYQDQGGRWTIGFGFTHDINGSPITANTPAITLTQASQMLAQIVIPYVDAVMTSINVTITQNKLDAMVSLCYNIGTNAFETSSIVSKLNSNQPVLPSDFTQYCHVNGVVNQGLFNRREKEFTLFTS